MYFTIKLDFKDSCICNCSSKDLHANMVSEYNIYKELENERGKKKEKRLVFSIFIISSEYIQGMEK